MLDLLYYSVFYNKLIFTKYCLSDLIVVWRAWELWPGNRYIRWALGIFMTATLGNRIYVPSSIITQYLNLTGRSYVRQHNKQWGLDYSAGTSDFSQSGRVWILSSPFPAEITIIYTSGRDKSSCHCTYLLQILVCISYGSPSIAHC
jgi:hypothetical protein